MGDKQSIMNLASIVRAGACDCGGTKRNKGKLGLGRSESRVSSIHSPAEDFPKISGSSLRNLDIQKYIVEVGTPLSSHQSLIVIVVDRHRSTCSRRIALVSCGVIVASLLVTCDDCGTHQSGTVDAVVLAYEEQPS